MPHSYKMLRLGTGSPQVLDNIIEKVVCVEIYPFPFFLRLPTPPQAPNSPVRLLVCSGGVDLGRQDHGELLVSNLLQRKVGNELRPFKPLHLVYLCQTPPTFGELKSLKMPPHWTEGRYVSCVPWLPVWCVPWTIQLVRHIVQVVAGQ